MDACDYIVKAHRLDREGGAVALRQAPVKADNGIRYPDFFVNATRMIAWKRPTSPGGSPPRSPINLRMALFSQVPGWRITISASGCFTNALSGSKKRQCLKWHKPRTKRTDSLREKQPVPRARGRLAPGHLGSEIQGFPVVRLRLTFGNGSFVPSGLQGREGILHRILLIPFQSKSRASRSS